MARRRLIDDPVNWMRDPRAADELKRADNPLPRGRSGYWAGFTATNKQRKDQPVNPLPEKELPE
jgi:hypothetical protein